MSPLRAGDVFGHPHCFLTLERATPLTSDDWTMGKNSQVLLMAIRHTSVEEPSRLRTFVEACIAMLDPEFKYRSDMCLLRQHYDMWLAGVGLARFVVAAATIPIQEELTEDKRRHYEGNERYAELWLSCEKTELELCSLLRELFRNPLS